MCSCCGHVQALTVVGSDLVGNSRVWKIQCMSSSSYSETDGTKERPREIQCCKLFLARWIKCRTMLLSSLLVLSLGTQIEALNSIRRQNRRDVRVCLLALPYPTGPRPNFVNWHFTDCSPINSNKRALWNLVLRTTYYLLVTPKDRNLSNCTQLPVACTTITSDGFLNSTLLRSEDKYIVSAA